MCMQQVCYLNLHYKFKKTPKLTKIKTKIALAVKYQATDNCNIINTDAAIHMGFLFRHPDTSLRGLEPDRCSY